MSGSGITVEFDDRGQVQRLLLDFKDADRGIKDRAADVFVATGPTFVRTMKRVVRVDTGALQRSLHFTVNRKMPRMRIGSLKRTKNPKSGKLAQTYAGYVHSGTWKMDPNPYVDIAYEQHTTDQGKFMRGLRQAGVANIPGRSTGGVRI